MQSLAGPVLDSWNNKTGLGKRSFCLWKKERRQQFFPKRSLSVLRSPAWPGRREGPAAGGEKMSSQGLRDGDGVSHSWTVKNRQARVRAPLGACECSHGSLLPNFDHGQHFMLNPLAFSRSLPTRRAADSTCSLASITQKGICFSFAQKIRR